MPTDKPIPHHMFYKKRLTFLCREGSWNLSDQMPRFGTTGQKKGRELGCKPCSRPVRLFVAHRHIPSMIGPIFRDKF